MMRPVQGAFSPRHVQTMRKRLPMSTTMTLSTRCGPVQPVGFSTQVSVTGFPPNQKLGIDLLDLDEKRLEVLASGTVTTDPNGALTALPVRIRRRPTGCTSSACSSTTVRAIRHRASPSRRCRSRAPCDVLYALTSFNFPQGTSSLRDSVEIVDVTVRIRRPISSAWPSSRSSTSKAWTCRRIAAGSTCSGATPPRPRFPGGAFDVATGSAIASLAVDINNQAVALSPDGQKRSSWPRSRSSTSVAAATMTLCANLQRAGRRAPDQRPRLLAGRHDSRGHLTGVVHLLDPVALTVIKSIPVVSAGGPFFDRMAAVFTDTNRLLLWASNRSEIYQIDLATQRRSLRPRFR